jgi:putative transposase
MLNPELRERLWPFLGGIAQTKRYHAQMHRRGCRPRSSAAVIANHNSHRQSHSMNKGWIIGLDSPDFRQLHNFSWQQGYGAFSVSISQLSETIHYIQNQVEHHRPELFNRNT